MTPVDTSKPSAIRILVSNLSQFRLEQIKQELENQPDILLVGETNNQIDLLIKAGEQIDIVLLDAPLVQPLPAIGTHLLSEYTDLKVMVLKNDENEQEACLYWLGLRFKKVDRLSAGQLPATLRWLKSLNSMD